MKVYSVGPDDLSEENLPSDFEWIVYWYEVVAYAARGEAISWDGEHLRSHDLSHCSCYGPMEDFNSGGCAITADDFESDNVLNKNYRPEVVRKVRELLGNST